MTELNEERSAKRWAFAAHISVPFSFILPIGCKVERVYNRAGL